MKRKAKKHAGRARKEHVLSEAELKKIAAGFFIYDLSKAFTDAPGRIADAFKNTGKEIREQWH